MRERCVAEVCIYVCSGMRVEEEEEQQVEVTSRGPLNNNNVRSTTSFVGGCLFSQNSVVTGTFSHEMLFLPGPRLGTSPIVP